MGRSHDKKWHDQPWLQLVIAVVVVLMISKLFVDLRSVKKAQATLVVQMQCLEVTQANMETLTQLHRQAMASLELNNNAYSQSFAVWNARSIIEEAQAILNNYGFYANTSDGHVDGDIKVNTRDAVRAFQRQKGLPITGRLTFEIYLYLLEYQAAHQGNGETKS